MFPADPPGTFRGESPGRSLRGSPGGRISCGIPLGISWGTPGDPLGDQGSWMHSVSISPGGSPRVEKPLGSPRGSAGVFPGGYHGDIPRGRTLQCGGNGEISVGIQGVSVDIWGYPGGIQGSCRIWWDLSFFGGAVNGFQRSGISTGRKSRQYQPVKPWDRPRMYIKLTRKV